MPPLLHKPHFGEYCDGVFKIFPKPQFVDDVKSNKKTWTFHRVEGILGNFDIEGLEVLTHSYFNNRMKKNVTIRKHLIDVKCV